jgi:hypothetical protein
MGVATTRQQCLGRDVGLFLGDQRPVARMKRAIGCSVAAIEAAATGAAADAARSLKFAVG